MSERALTTTNGVSPALLERVLVDGNLEQLTPAQRLEYYRATCESLGLNPLTKPFQYIKLQGRLTLYATRDATDQLRKLHGVSTTIVSREQVNGVYVVTARATMPDGRTEESIGAVSIDRLSGDALANALMKAETKAKRRVTLSIVGLGWLDETETETVPGAEAVTVDQETGEIVDAPTPARQAPPRQSEFAAMFKEQLDLYGHTIGDVASVTGISQPTPRQVKEWLERHGLTVTDLMDRIQEYKESLQEAREGGTSVSTQLGLD